MTEQPADAVEVLFDQAASLPPEERAAFLDAACRGNVALRAELESLLAYDRQATLADNLLKSPVVRGPENAPAPEAPGISRRVSDTEPIHQRAAAEGHIPPTATAPPRDWVASLETPPSFIPGPAVEIPGYAVLDRLGIGGMGVVYKARHLRLDRVVALKVIRSGEHASPAELARFRTEAQAAARLQHPNIVQIFEVGEAHGQPFLCMEFVEGRSLGKLINGTPWPSGQAAQLVETLARAIEAAHRENIVHRDLKPDNILLVGTRGEEREARGAGANPSSLAPHPSSLVPKITDFGLAKMLASDQGQTESGAFLGSPSYAAPEQAGAHNSKIGPHTDIYALGAVLYELLTGRPPFTGVTLLETIEQVLHKEPVSLRLFNPSTPPDLEAICLKCLEKNPARRYARAEDLAEDLRRWQHHEPIQARAPGALGRAARWCRRHPTLTAIAAVLLLGLLGTSWQWRAAVAAGDLAEEQREAAQKAEKLAESRREDAEKASQEADQARKSAVEDAAVAREIATFLGGLFEEADPFVPTGRVFGEQPTINPTALDMVNRGAKRLANPALFKEKPLLRAELLDTVGHVYISLGEGAKAAPFVIEALDLRRKYLPPVHADLATSLHNAGFLQLAKGNFKKSAEFFTDAANMRTQLFGAGSPQAMSSRNHLAIAKTALDDPSAEPLLLETLKYQRARFQAAEKQGSQVGEEALDLGFTLIALCNFYAQQRKIFKAPPYLDEARKLIDRIANKELADFAKHFLAYRTAHALNQLDQADRELRRALEVIEKRTGTHHFIYVALLGERAYMYFDKERYEEAEQAFLELEANLRKTAGDDGLALAKASYQIARSIARGQLTRAGRANDVARIRELAVRIEQYGRAAYEQGKRDGAEDLDIATYAVFLAHALLYIKPEPDNAAAEALAREAVRIRTDVHGIGHELTSHPRAFLFLALARQNKVDDLESIMLDLLARNPHPKWDVNSADGLPEAARTLARAGKTRTALLFLEQVTRAGYYKLNQARSDPAFASLCESEEFRQLAAKLRK
jgi:serine/threonine protein kinase